MSKEDNKNGSVVIAPYKELEPENFTVRDWLAIDRTRLANERTTLAYIRTAFMFLVSAATLLKLLDGSLWIYTLAGFLFATSGVIAVVGGIRFFQERRKYWNMVQHPEGVNPSSRSES